VNILQYPVTLFVAFFSWIPAHVVLAASRTQDTVIVDAAPMTGVGSRSAQGNGQSAMIDLPPFPSGTQAMLNTPSEANADNKAEKNGEKNGEKKQGTASETTAWDGPDANVQDSAFQELLKQQFPMSPDQMKMFRETLNVYERSLQKQVRNPTPVVSTRTVSLEPGAVPPVVRISSGYVSSLLFLDETGSAWPIQAYDIGNPKAFNIQWDKKSNLLMIQGLVPYANTNMVILLNGLATPVILNLQSDQDKVDYRLDLRVPGAGPNAASPMIPNAIPVGGDVALMNLLDGVPPVQAIPLAVTGGAAQAWLMGDQDLLLRTRLTVLSPAYQNSMRSADGTKVYRMKKTPVILAVEGGNTVQLGIGGY
jgi:intracellular multiplication protein IcmK